MNTKPQIKLSLSPLDNTVELASKVFLAVTWCFTFYALIKLPTTIPIHFNASGQANYYSNKITLLVLPVIGSILYFGLTQLNKYPHVFNYLTKITEDNAQRQYTIATRTVRFLKLIILVHISLIIALIYSTSIGLTNGLGPWFLVLMIGLFFIPAIFSIVQSLKKS